MRCYCFKCYNNEDGYCSCSSYVAINENGKCTIMDIDIPLCIEMADNDIKIFPFPLSLC
ncbi:MAG: hypothetical protein J6T10_28725 [Methanobrevibacter sp.]|nr:hypothetical protein [Methanobrevibacter sp.]